MSASLSSINHRNPSTPQTTKARADQVKNDAGGYTFAVSDFDLAKRFIILGAYDGFYRSGQTIAKENADNLVKIIENGGSKDLVDYIVEVSTQGRAAKQQPGLFALAVASSYGTADEKRYALSQLNAVARTGTTFFEFISFALQFRGWGRALKNAVASWYTDRATKNLDSLAYQTVKYGSRAGWTHGDALRVSHAKGGEDFDALAQYLLGRNDDLDTLPNIVKGFEKAKAATNESDLIKIIQDHGLSWEMTPNDMRTPSVWKALLPQMPLGALLRQLPTLTRKGLLEPLSDELKAVCARLTDATEIEKARLHPIGILLAHKVYESGGYYSRGSSGGYQPSPKVLTALDKAYHLAFKNVKPTGKRFVIGVDVSGSMSARLNDSVLTSYDASAALSNVIARTEPETAVYAFSAGSSYRPWGSRGSGLTQARITGDQSLSEVRQEFRRLSAGFGGTDCALPIQHALENKIFTDVFLVITDNDTWAGGRHTHEVLAEYRRKVNPNAKLAVLATEGHEFSIADPKDPFGQMDIAGFDSAVPSILREFVIGF